MVDNADRSAVEPNASAVEPRTEECGRWHRNIQSLERAAAMLRLLAGGERRLGLSDIASSLGLAKGTAHGILRTLQHEGFVEQDAASGRYQLGAELLRLGNSYLDVHELRARALVWTDDLARSSGESVHLGVLHQQGVLIVHHVFRPDDSRQVLEVGAMQPLHSTALGKVLVRLRPGGAQRGRWRRSASAFTARTVTGPARIRGVLDADPGAGLGGGPGGDLGGRRLGGRPHPRPAPDAGGRGGDHGAVERVCDGGELRPGTGGGGTGLRPGRLRAISAPGGSELGWPGSIGNRARLLGLLTTLDGTIASQDETAVHRSALSNTYRQYALVRATRPQAGNALPLRARTTGGTRGPPSLDEGQRSRGCPAPTSSSARPSVPPS